MLRIQLNTLQIDPLLVLEKLQCVINTHILIILLSYILLIPKPFSFPYYRVYYLSNVFIRCRKNGALLLGACPVFIVSPIIISKCCEYFNAAEIFDSDNTYFMGTASFHWPVT